MSLIPALARARAWARCSPPAFALGLLALVVRPLSAQTALTLDPSAAQTIRTIDRPLIGENVTWLMSSDRKFNQNLAPSDQRTTRIRDKLVELGVGYARFPYGTLSQNYRWHTPTGTSGAYDYSSAVTGLKPRVATMNNASATFEWAVNDDGTFKSALDFDEFIEYCHFAGIEPIVCVNVTGGRQRQDHSYDTQEMATGVLTDDDMAKEAAAWVYYANQVRGYNVKYWEIGNEVESDPDISGVSDYITLFNNFAARMKAAVPNVKILVSPGTHSGTNWLASIIANATAKPNVDFLIAHQYGFRSIFFNSYDTWRASTSTLNDLISTVRDVNAFSTNNWAAGATPDVLVTEFGPIGTWREDIGLGRHAFFFNSQKLYLTMGADGSVVLTATAPTNQATGMLDVEWVGSTATAMPDYMTITAVNNGITGYLTAPTSGTGPVTWATTITDDSQWRFRGGSSSSGSAIFFESKTHPGYVVNINSSKQLVLDGTALRNSNSGQSISFQAAATSGEPNLLGKTRMWVEAQSGRFFQYDSATGKIVAPLPRADSQNQYVEYTLVMDQPTGFASGSVRLAIEEPTVNGTVLHYLQVDPSNAANPVLTTTTDPAAAMSPAYSWAKSYNADGSYTFKSDNSATAHYLTLDPTSFTLTAGGDGTAAGLCTLLPKTIPGPAAVTWPTAPTSSDPTLDNDFGKGLVHADMALAALPLAHVRSMVHWNTQTGWKGQFGVWGDTSAALEPDQQMGLTPLGVAEKFVSTYALGRVLNLPAAPTTTLRTYACMDDSTGRLILLVLNKDTASASLALAFNNFTPASTTYATATYHSTTDNIEDLWPVIDTGTATMSGNLVTIPPLCVQALIFSDPTKATPPTTQPFLLNSLASSTSVAAGSTWVKRTATGLAAVSTPQTFTGGVASLFDLGNLFTLGQATAGASNSYQLSAFGFAPAYLTVGAGYSQQLSFAASATDPKSLWSWLPKATVSGPPYNFVQMLPGALTPGTTSNYARANITSGTGDMPLDALGGTSAWARFTWVAAPVVPGNNTKIMIRSAANDYLMHSATTGGLGVWFNSNLPAPTSTPTYSHRFTVAYVGNGLLTLQNEYTGGYLKAASGGGAVTTTGTSNTDPACQWKPFFSADNTSPALAQGVWLQSQLDGTFLSLQANGSVATTDTAPSANGQMYWIPVRL